MDNIYQFRNSLIKEGNFVDVEKQIFESLDKSSSSNLGENLSTNKV